MATACVTLFLLVIVATSKAASISSHSCNLNTPSLSASGDDVDMIDLSQVNTSLKYCMIDNCTIMRIDTGEELEIIHTTESLLVAVPTDGHTSEIVLTFDNETLCVSRSATTGSNLFLIGTSVLLVIALGSISAYIVAVHLLFPELQTVFGILLMSYNAAVLIATILDLLSYIIQHAVAVGSQLVCQAMITVFSLVIMVCESYSTCILFHVTYTMYRSFKLKSDMPKNLLFFYNCFVFGLVAVFAVIIIGYDLYSGNGKQTILPSGYCLFYNDYSYQTQVIKDISLSGNKVAQFSLFVIFLFYYCKQRMRSTIAPLRESTSSIRISKLLFRIAVAMGAVVGIARIIWVATAILAPNYAYITTAIGLIAYLFQQCVVMFSFMCTQKMSRLCRERFYPQEDQQ